LRRRRPTAGETLRVSNLVLNDGTREVHLADRPIELTTREFDLLKLLMQHPNQVLPREKILDQVWGYNFYGDENNVEVYIRYLRQKLGDEDRQLIQTVRGVGYRIAPGA
jgi:DNA-binding response OmpR family regulator